MFLRAQVTALRDKKHWRALFDVITDRYFARFDRTRNRGEHNSLGETITRHDEPGLRGFTGGLLRGKLRCGCIQHGTGNEVARDKILVPFQSAAVLGDLGVETRDIGSSCPLFLSQLCGLQMGEWGACLHLVTGIVKDGASPGQELLGCLSSRQAAELFS